MKSTLQKSFLFLAVTGAIFWFGGTAVRGIIGYELLEPGTIEMRIGLPPQAERELYRLISYSSIVVLTGYLSLLAGAAGFLWTTSLAMKTNGWLMMSLILIGISAPLELYSLYLDYQMIYNEFFKILTAEEWRYLFIRRLTALGGAPVVGMFCTFTAIPLAIWQPFVKKEK